MEVSELIKLDSRKVRGSSYLMSIYIDAFEKQFGRKPACAGCTFANDFAKLIAAVNGGLQPKKSVTLNKRTMENTFKLKKIQSKILAYKKEGKTFRVYDNLMKEDFAVQFLTHGSDEQLAERKKMFAVLPEALQPKTKKSEAKPETVEEAPTEAGNAEELNQPIVVEESVGKVNVKVRKPRKNKK